MLRGSAGLGTSFLLGSRAHAADYRALRVQVTGDAEVIDPANRSGIADEDIIPLIFSNLIKYKGDNSFEWELDAASDIRQVDDTHVRFSLRPGIQWTNGFGDLTAEDVKFTYERFLDTTHKAVYKGDWDFLDHVEVQDKYSGVLVLKYPFVPLWSSTLPGASGAIICKKALEANGGKFPTDPPVSAGPYIVKELVPQQRQVLVRNPAWNGQRYEVDEFRMIVVADEKSAERAFEAGELDLSEVSATSVDRYRANPPKESTLVIRPSANYYWLGMNTEHPLYKDIRVRKAIQKAVNVDEVIKAAFGNTAQPAYGIVPTGLLGARTSVKYKYDPQAAKAELTAAGAGAGFSTTLHCMNKTEQITAVQVIQANLADVGIKAEIKALETGAFWALGQQAKGDMYKDLQLYLIRFGLGGTPDPFYATEWFTCEQVGVWNWERICNPEFDKLHKAALSEADPKKRAETYIRMQEMMEDTGAYVFLTHGNNAVLYRDSIVPSIMPQGRYTFTLKKTRFV
jgi:peptide/nickel transport system substrate-binding protein